MQPVRYLVPQTGLGPGMKIENCWEVMGCGRNPGGSMVGPLGVCPAAQPGSHSGVNGGENGGRICWAVAGTFCNGEVIGECIAKGENCTECEFFHRVRRQAGASFELLAPSQAKDLAWIEQFVSVMSIIESLNAAVYVTDLDTCELLFVNPYTEKLFGKDLVGKQCFRVFQVDQTSPCAHCTNVRLLVDGQPGPAVMREVQNPRTHRWFRCTDQAIPWWDGRFVLMVIAIDITERKAAEEFRDQYVGLISHDLRNPLTSVTFRAQLLRKSLAARGFTDECEALDSLITSANRMAVLLSDLLETTKLESGRIELHELTVDLGEWAAGAARLAPAAKRDRIEVRIEPEPIRVLADANRLDRVLENLLSNALKFSGEQPVSVVVRRREGEALITVSDKGVGVAADELPKLFERFYRAESAGQVKGTGLGLYNARLIVEAHRGRIWAESEIGRGTEVHVALPLLEI